MNKYKYLIIDSRPESWVRLMALHNTTLASPYKKMSFVQKLFREFNRYLNKYLSIPVFSCWFNTQWKDHINEYCFCSKKQ